MAVDIGVGIFALGSWDFDCSTLKSVVTPPPIDPITKEIPNTFGAAIGVGGSILSWIAGQISDLFSSDTDKSSATDKINKKLEKKKSFQGAVRGHIFAQGYSVPCDPATKKQHVGWHWYITLTLVASADAGVGSGDGFVTVQLGPFTGEDKVCDCTATHASVPAHNQLHVVGGSLLSVRVTSPGAALVSEGVAYPPITALTPFSETPERLEVLGGTQIVQSDAPLALTSFGVIEASPATATDQQTMVSSKEPLSSALTGLKGAIAAIEAALQCKPCSEG